MRNGENTNTNDPERARRFFERVLDLRVPILVGAVASIVCFGAFLPTLHKDTRADAFVPTDHPALALRDRVREVFGLADPIVVAVVADEEAEQGVFTPDGLDLVARLTEALEDHPGIDSALITSLATEDDIVASETGIEVRPFFEAVPTTLAEARAAHEAVLDFPLYRGSLASEDGRATLIVAELDAEVEAGDVYASVLALAQQVVTPPGLTVHVAGEAGVTGHLGHYIDADARRMIPVAFVMIVLVLSRTYRSIRSVMLPIAVVIGGATLALGSMAAAGVPYYLISTALPVILVGIGVADGIHVLGQYYLELDRDPSASQRELVVRAMAEMWRPVSITSVTDSIGFLSLSASTDIPPMRDFGIFAAVGVLGLWAFSMLALPAALSMLAPRAPRTRRGTASEHRTVEVLDGPAARLLGRAGSAVARRPGRALGTAGLLVIFGAAGALTVHVDYERIGNFGVDEPIALADRAINDHLDGTSYLDVMVSGLEPGSLLEPNRLARIQTFQHRIEALPHVRSSMSIVDYLTRMNRAFHGDRPDAAVLPEDRAAIAQLLLLYEMQSTPDALEKVLDFERQRANVRVRLDSSRYSDEEEVVSAAEALVEDVFAGANVRVHFAGRVNVDVQWMGNVARSHVASVVFALVGIFLASAALFRSLVAGLLTALPAALAVLTIYGIMVLADIWLGITTAMFAAIAIGLGVDFSVHLIDRLRVVRRTSKGSLESDFATIYAETGRILLFNFACLAVGLGVLMLSHVPTIAEFGLLTAAAVVSAFLAAMSVIPALVALLRPDFLAGEDAPVAAIVDRPGCVPEAPPVGPRAWALSPMRALGRVPRDREARSVPETSAEAPPAPRS